MDDGNARCLGYRPALKKPYQYLTYKEVLEKARDFGSALINKLHLKPGDETYLGIYARNCPEWFISAFGCTLQSVSIVPLYDTFGPDAITYILQQIQMTTIVVDTFAKAEKLLAKSELFPSLKTIIVIEEKLPEKLTENYRTAQIYTFNEILKEGHNDIAEMNLPKPQNTYIICYTSGTTSFPKGVIISHRNIVANLSAFYLLLKKFSPDFFLHNPFTTISYLPLSHMFEQMCHWFTFLVGGSTSYYSGNIQLLTEDLADIQPNLLPVVPRLLNRFYDLIQVKLKKGNPVVRALFNYAYQKKLAMLKEGIICNDTIWDKLIFQRLQAKLGGKVQFMAIGSAPISAEVLETCRVVFGAVIIEGKTDFSEDQFLMDHVSSSENLKLSLCDVKV
ncbi:unnamed protein product [Anisakis simplex]|uniref:long-chain-fatty-acid--CoA ligase n=1 Tax=Anisakis simplex TaxID=6269 RepID=A0A3P6NQV1_ANISI|nr:unnamed protein product [Anisakis simplex]